MKGKGPYCEGISNVALKQQMKLVKKTKQITKPKFRFARKIQKM